MIISAMIKAKRIVYDTFKDINKVFNEAINHAKITGKIFAIALALGYPFKS